MYDAGKILAGLAAFVAVALLPVWHNAVAPAAPRPELKLVTQERHCVDDVVTMRAAHMNLLNRWRDAVVREGVRTTVTPSGMTVTMSLTKTCMRCHPNKKDFCDACHTYLAVSPTCWVCHVEPKEASL